MADILTDDDVKNEITPDAFEAMFMQESGAAPADSDAVKDVTPEATKDVTPEPEPVVVVPEPVKEEPVKVVAPEPVKVVAPEPVKVVAPEPIEYTAEEQTFIDNVKKDFPEITQVLAAQERLLTATFEAKLKDALAGVQQTLAPIHASTAEAAAARHEALILAQHADARTILPEVETWIAAQPAYLQPAYNRVLDAGTAAEVIDLFTNFKTAAGRVETPAGKTPEQIAEETRLAAEKARKLASQEGIKGKRAESFKDKAPAGFEDGFASVT